MKEQVMQRLVLALNALNSISVSGKTNLANLSGSIVMLEEIVNILNGVEIIEKSVESDEK